MRRGRAGRGGECAVRMKNRSDAKNCRQNVIQSTDFPGNERENESSEARYVVFSGPDTSP
jgi:hypothetical protein